MKMEKKNQRQLTTFRGTHKDFVEHLARIADMAQVPEPVDVSCGCEEWKFELTA